MCGCTSSSSGGSSIARVLECNVDATGFSGGRWCPRGSSVCVRLPVEDITRKLSTTRDADSDDTDGDDDTDADKRRTSRYLAWTMLHTIPRPAHPAFRHTLTHIHITLLCVCVAAIPFRCWRKLLVAVCRRVSHRLNTCACTHTHTYDANTCENRHTHTHIRNTHTHTREQPDSSSQTRPASQTS